GSPSSQRQSTNWTRTASTVPRDCATLHMGSTTRRGMHRRVWVVTGVLLALAGIAVSGAGASAYFWDRSRADVIAHGVTIGRVAVGGLHAAQARALLEARFAARLRRPVELVRGPRTFTVNPSSTGPKIEVG